MAIFSMFLVLPFLEYMHEITWGFIGLHSGVTPGNASSYSQFCAWDTHQGTVHEINPQASCIHIRPSSSCSLTLATTLALLFYLSWLFQESTKFVCVLETFEIKCLCIKWYSWIIPFFNKHVLLKKCSWHILMYSATKMEIKHGDNKSK